MQDNGQARHPTSHDKEKEPIVPKDVDTLEDDELFRDCSPNLSRSKISMARSRQKHSHRLSFSNADNGTFHRARRETCQGQNQPNEVPGNASALHMGVVPPLQPVYLAFGTGPTLYIPPVATIQSPDDMLSLPLRRHILDYELPHGFVIPAFTMFDDSIDPYDHMLHYNQSMTLNAGNDLLLYKVFPASLRGPALAWFHKLPRNSINMFYELWGLFISQHLCSVRQKRNISSLQTILKHEEESIRDFTKRFGQVVQQIEFYSMDAVLQNFRRSFGPSTPFIHSLFLYPPIIMEELYKREDRYSTLEDNIRVATQTVKIKNQPIVKDKQVGKKPSMSNKGQNGDRK